MILVFECDTRKYGGRRFMWRPRLWHFAWHGSRTLRLVWGLWSISYYPEPGLYEYHRYIADGNTEWYDECNRRTPQCF